MTKEHYVKPPSLVFLWDSWLFQVPFHFAGVQKKFQNFSYERFSFMNLLNKKKPNYGVPMGVKVIKTYKFKHVSIAEKSSKLH